MTYPRIPESLDADAPLGKRYQPEIELADGDALTGGTATLVDATSSFAAPVPLLAISEITPVQLPDLPGNIWGIRFRARGLSAGSGEAFVRLEYQTALGNDDHSTVRLIVEQR